MAAGMTMTQLCSRLATLMRAGTTSNVEAYWREEAPTALTCYIQPNNTGPEAGFTLDSGVSGGTYTQRHFVDFVCEGPWADDVTSHENLDALVEEIRAVVRANRDISYTGYANCTNGRNEVCRYVYAQRPGTAAKTVFVAMLTASWRTGQGA